ncbi:hypothetical protein BHM03_00040028 [Ensete ventricosum]|nr:hypothetical protein BHM03_00040028 [Ensete ventricosum]
MCVSSSVSVGERLGSSGEVGWACSGTCLGWVCSRACLELLLLGVCRGILHEGLIEVGMPDVAPPTIKSVSRSRLNLNTVCRVVSIDALEVGLRFPLHPIIEECLRWWRISPNHVAPNSWRYLIVFLRECQGASIVLSRDLFMACFHLCKS